jgi:L-methionine (R)-S-oxide reductase
LATPRISLGKGVCGETWQRGQTIIVSDVKNCKNYIACDSATKSEIVIPIWDHKEKVGIQQEIVAVWDIDSAIINRFDEVD